MKKQNIKLVKKLKDLTDLFEIAKTVASTLDLDKVLSSILKSAMQIANTPSGSIALYDEKNNQMTIHASEGFSKEFISKRQWVIREGGLTEKILSNNYPLVVGNTDRKRFFKSPLLKAENIMSLVAAPLIFHNKVVGILYVDDFNKRTFSNNTLKLLSILASFAAMSIDNARLHKETLKLAITDELTCIHNRRYFKEILDDEIARATRYNLYVSLILLDLDDFKKLNDEYGHIMGDKCLKIVSKSILNSIREVDCAARYGGEEFVVILPENDIDSAYIVAERIRNNVIKFSKELLKSKNGHITVTLGVASYPNEAMDAEDLIKKSDEAMYFGKYNGKNCTVRYDKIEGRPNDETAEDSLSEIED